MPPQNPGQRFWRRFALAFAVAILVSLALTLPWRWLPPPTTAFMLQHRLVAEGPVRHQWVPWRELSSALPISVVAAEDQKFPLHCGFDFNSISQAIQENRRICRGASTISQQVAKNLYLWPGRSLVRKALEAYFTVLIELTWPKRRILEVYLNVAEFGPGIYGVGAASRAFFGKPPAKITSREAALLAAVLPGPKSMSAARPSNYVRKRGADIQAAVKSLGGPGYLKQM